MDAFNRADMKKVKALITCKTDRYRAPYGRTVEDHPRRCIFVGDTNEQHYLDDPTGARRFWPIRCTRINWAILKMNREQYFAEAMQDLRDGKEWHVFDEAAAAVEQEQRRVQDEWEPFIREWLVGHRFVTSLEVLVDCLKIQIGKSVRVDQFRVGRVMRVLGWKNKIVNIEGKATRGWVREYGD